MGRVRDAVLCLLAASLLGTASAGVLELAFGSEAPTADPEKTSAAVRDIAAASC